MQRRTIAALLTIALLLVALPWPLAAASSSLRYVDQHLLPSKMAFRGTTVGGLSGITFDVQRNLYFAVSDDRGEYGPPRVYTLRIRYDENGFKEVTVVNVVTLDGDAALPGVQPYDANDSDTEDIVLLPWGELFVASEQDRDGRPWVRRFKLGTGLLLGGLAIPERFLPRFEIDAAGQPVQTGGVRRNLGFEALAVTPDRRRLFLANEQAIVQDGPMSTPEHGTTVRILQYALGAADPQQTAEWVYQTEPIPVPPSPAGAPADNGVSAIAYVKHLMPEYDFVVMERSFVAGYGNTVRLYGVSVDGADDVSTLDALPQPFTGRQVRKTLLVDVGGVGVKPDNLEGMVIGPALPNGNHALILVSDDNFSAFDPPQVNQFLLFEIVPGA